MVNGVYLAGGITFNPQNFVHQVNDADTIKNTWVIVNIHSDADLCQLVLDTLPYMNGWTYDTYTIKAKPEPKYINGEYFTGIPHLLRFDMCVKVVRAMDPNVIDMDARWIQDAAD